MITTVDHRPAIAQLRRLLAEGTRRASGREGGALVSATVRIPPFDAVAGLRLAEHTNAAAWTQPSEGFSLLAIGNAEPTSHWGEGSLSRAALDWKAAVSSAIVLGDASCPVAQPVAVGGVSFDPQGRLPDSPWQAFPDAELTFPRFVFTTDATGSWLTVNAAVRPGSDLTSILAEAASLLNRPLPQGEASRDDAGGRAAPAQDDAGDERWTAAVNAAKDRIETGRLEKVVVAREAGFSQAAPFDIGDCLHRLQAGYAHCTVFAYRKGASCFVGATPERLVRLRGRMLDAGCLAGSRPRGATPEEDAALGEALLADHKERFEHEVVLRTVGDTLAPLCTELSIPETPSLLRAPNVQHLSSPVTAIVASGTTLLDLVEGLNPTPATCGLPKEAALEFIRGSEPFDRGWYSGAVGWVDATGSGEFAVSIRSALLTGNEALLYAGCGIVDESDPVREYEEVCLKLRPMRWALKLT